MKKNITIIIAIFILGSKITAQIQPPNNDLNKFEGTWRWTSGLDTVLIVLEKQIVTPYPNCSAEILVGWHKYVKNGVLNQSSLQYVGRDINIDRTSTANDLKTTITGGTSPLAPNDCIFRTFWDLELHKSFSLYFSMLPNSTTQAKWEIKGRGIAMRNTFSINAASSIPKNLILTKL